VYLATGMISALILDKLPHTERYGNLDLVGDSSHIDIGDKFWSLILSGSVEGMDRIGLP
jgi:hypothetical protein